ncbi:MAG: glutathione S-transferase N-terminal domain-containing protein [Gammaproteobacteria bacterium]|nr:glutathione S-transferase N-terminal domain-containing protein [Gammaproteobacteria bacterium]MDH5513330.1 glutathione S-transferase N-terminal domain-containing protein [Gammaproteobacteria bacterium]
MKLYGSLTSPYVRKARILLQEKKIPCEFTVADAWAADSPVPALNPLGKVPVLVLDNQDVLFDSPVIVEYLDALTPPAWLPAAGQARWETLRWQALADGLLDAAVIRFLESRRPAAQQSADIVRRQEEKIARAIDFVAQHLPRGSWLMADRFTLADLFLGVALEYTDFRYPHDWRGRQPRLGEWLAGISARPSFTDTRPPG